MYHVIPEMVDSNPHTKRTETFTAPESGFLWLADVERFEEWDKSEKHVTWETLKNTQKTSETSSSKKGVTQHHTRLHISNTSNNPQPQKRTKKRDNTQRSPNLGTHSTLINNQLHSDGEGVMWETWQRKVKLGDGQPYAVFDIVDSLPLDAVSWRVFHHHSNSRSDRIGQC